MDFGIEVPQHKKKGTETYAKKTHRLITNSWSGQGGIDSFTVTTIITKGDCFFGLLSGLM